MKLINIGFGNMVSARKLVAIVSPESAPIKRIIQDARDRGSLIDATYGRRTPCGYHHRFGSRDFVGGAAETVANRLGDDEDGDEEDE